MISSNKIDTPLKQSLNSHVINPVQDDSQLSHYVMGSWYICEPRPWRRYSARFIDIAIIASSAGFGLGIIISMVAPDLLDIIIKSDNIANKFFFNLIGGFFTSLINIIFMAKSGSTIGKWLFGIKVVNKYLKLPSFSASFQREVMVVIRGMGFYVPLITFFTMIAGYRTLSKNKITSWDKELELTVLYHDVGYIRFTFIALIITFLYYF